MFPTYKDTNDIVTYQFSYLNIGDGAYNISDPICGYLNTNVASRTNCHVSVKDYHIGLIEALEQQYPQKPFIYWTTSLARSMGTQTGLTFNNGMRDYARNNHKILFDFADIISYTPTGQPCYDDRDGVPYTRLVYQSDVPQEPLADNSENFPDDGLNLPAICQWYTAEAINGHLVVGAAQIRAAKAFWILLAQIAGWVPGSVGPSPSPLPSIIPTPQPSVTPSPLVSPTPSPARCLPLGDIDCSGKINSLDFGSIAKYWGTNTYIANLNNSGLVDGADARLLLNSYLQ